MVRFALFAGSAPGQRAAMHTVVAIFAIVVGIFVIGQWTVSLASRNVPELATEPWAIGFHLGAEALMALCLIAAGAAFLAGASWGEPLLAVALGMTLYSIVASSGYFAQRHQPAPIVMFGALMALTALAVGVLLGAIG
jgi:hypothetical protein